MALRIGFRSLPCCSSLQWRSQRYTSDVSMRHYEVHDRITAPVGKHAPIWQASREAMNVVRSGHNIFVHGMAATPTILLKGLCRHVLENDIKNLNMIHLLLEGEVPWNETKYEGKLHGKMDIPDWVLADNVAFLSNSVKYLGSIRSNSLFTGQNMRDAVNDGKADQMSVFLSEVSWLFRRHHLPVDVALIHISTPDRNGFCSLGTTVDCTRSAIVNAKHRIALVNPNMPRTLGDAILHHSHIDVMVFGNHLPYERPTTKPSEQEKAIGKLISENLVEDGATLQLGIGSIPDTCVGGLKDHKDLGIHTEMISDGVLKLVQSSAVTNARKVIHPGKITCTYVYGSYELYEFCHDNPMIMMGDISWVNDSTIIRQNPQVTAINAAIEIDLTGQIVADSIGRKIVSGFGGQADFNRGAALCNDGRGRPIIALTSQANDGTSKIVPYIHDGAGVVTTRASCHYIVTEYGIAYLFGKNMRQRAYELIKIAHPNHRENLEKSSYDRLKCMPSPD